MNILDRYIIKQFLSTLIFSLVALCIIFLIVNLLETLDEFLDQNATFELIIKYYIHFFPEIIKLLTPVAMLLTTLFTIGRMSTANEITAMKSGGLSLYRLILPLTVLSVIISFGQLYFNGWVVPVANQTKLEIEREYLNKGKSGGPIYNLYFRDSPNKNIVMRYYNSKNKTGNKVSIEEFTSNLEPRLISRVEAEKVTWDSVSSEWILFNGIKRTYHEVKVTTSTFDSSKADMQISHKQILQLKRSTKEMNFDEFRDYISLLKLGGKDVRRLLIEYYGGYALPFANLIVIIFGVPFASVKKKGGIALQIGSAMVISFFYLIFINVGQAIGYAYNINPVVSGWMANIFFFVAGIINLIKTRT